MPSRRQVPCQHGAARWQMAFFAAFFRETLDRPATLEPLPRSNRRQLLPRKRAIDRFSSMIGTAHGSLTPRRRERGGVSNDR